jgi:hypothetical protein
MASIRMSSSNTSGAIEGITCCSRAATTYSRIGHSPAVANPVVEPERPDAANARAAAFRSVISGCQKGDGPVTEKGQCHL